MHARIRLSFLPALLLLLSSLRPYGAEVPPNTAAGYIPLPTEGLVLPAALTRGKLDFILARDSSASVRLNGRSLPSIVTDHGFRAFLCALPVDYTGDNALITATTPVTTLEKRIPVIAHENTIKNVSSIVLPDAKAKIRTDKGNEARIAEENKRIQGVLTARTPQQFTLPFAYPLADPVVTSVFGKKRNYYEAKKKILYFSYHLGLDFRAVKGAPVYSTADGTVLLAAETLVRGKVVYVDHGLGIICAYMHLDQLFVEEGRKVSRGTILGGAGTTGLSTGVHLHWSVYLNGVNADGHSLVDLTARLRSAEEALGRMDLD